MEKDKNKIFKKEFTNRYLLAVSALIILLAIINLNKIDNIESFKIYKNISPSSSLDEYKATIRFLTNVIILPAVAVIFYTVFTLYETIFGKVYKSVFGLLIIMTIVAMITLLRPVTIFYYLIIILLVILFYLIVTRKSSKNKI